MSGYEDFSDAVDDSQPLMPEENGIPREQHFPVKLHLMLSELEADKMANIVGWQPHGRCFVVRDQKLFVDIVLAR